MAPVANYLPHEIWVSICRPEDHPLRLAPASPSREMHRCLGACPSPSSCFRPKPYYLSLILQTDLPGEPEVGRDKRTG
ncbi:unnamed protein product, partial [Pleuronectes platessa]